MTPEEKLAEAAARGLQHLVLYQTATGAWDCTARCHEKTRVVIGHSTLRTPGAAMSHALDEFLSRIKADTATEEDVFG